jgi:hypothetical protein
MGPRTRLFQSTLHSPVNALSTRAEHHRQEPERPAVDDLKSSSCRFAGRGRAPSPWQSRSASFIEVQVKKLDAGRFKLCHTNNFPQSPRSSHLRDCIGAFFCLSNLAELQDFLAALADCQTCFGANALTAPARAARRGGATNAPRRCTGRSFLSAASHCHVPPLAFVVITLPHSSSAGA